MTGSLDETGRTERLIFTVTRTMARLSGIAILLCTALIFVEVVSRKLLGISLVGADEISEYVLAVSVTWGASFALVRRAHVRIDILHAQLPRALQSIFDILALVSMLFFAGLLAWFATQLLRTNIRFGAVSNTSMEIPLWIPQSLWVVGLWTLVAVTAVLILLCLRALLKGDFAEVSRIAGIRGAMVEAREETVALKGTN
ncbi:TRAP transporter small permease subunit [Shimia abyssi]|uniref:TRAP transporter small permease protein n=1 Tax=Shimia abyssi TaxID=1662395 RepID=A0A2P8FB69_9RHOB|nr:TRAP transporter small permease [Shimia abyssi]PSL18970.1 TRAP-type mannitol/chloroaromatic compound transport system permease small subunit [Shimia abyssi]